MSKSILEFAHLLRWCLKDGCPLPLGESELNEWAKALDDNVPELDQYEPGALLDLADAMGVPPMADPVARAREGFRRRLVQTPGVITSDGRSAEPIGASILVRAIDYPVAPKTLEHFGRLRADMLMPDGRELFAGPEVWRHARELALGMTYVWNPWPPDAWRLPRKKWASFVRAIVKSPHNDYDTEAQVAEAVTLGYLPPGRPILTAWKDVEKTFVPNVEPRWHDDRPLQACVEWMRRNNGLVWTSHAFFGRRLSELAGTKYYGQRGLTDAGEFIDRAPTSRAIVVSASANRTGRNLQHWAKNLIVCPEGNSEWWQQLLGRTHRSGQRADTVEVDVMLGCLEHVEAWRAARAGARAVRETTGADAKILIADVDDSWPSADELAARTDARWKVPRKTPFRIPTLTEEDEDE